MSTEIKHTYFVSLAIRRETSTTGSDDRYDKPSPKFEAEVILDYKAESAEYIVILNRVNAQIALLAGEIS